MDGTRGAGHTTARALIWTVSGIAVVVTGLIVGSFAFGWFSDATADRRGQTAEQERLADGDYRVTRYGLFFDLCHAIVAKEGEIAEAETAVAEGSDRTQRFYDEQNLRALRSVRRELIGRYNADAAKEGTAGQFRDSRLPFAIDAEGVTTCAA